MKIKSFSNSASLLDIFISTCLVSINTYFWIYKAKLINGAVRAFQMKFLNITIKYGFNTFDHITQGAFLGLGIVLCVFNQTLGQCLLGGCIAIHATDMYMNSSSYSINVGDGSITMCSLIKVDELRAKKLPTGGEENEWYLDIRFNSDKKSYAVGAATAATAGLLASKYCVNLLKSWSR